MQPSDLEIIDRIRGGDRDAYRLLVERYSRRVFRLAYRLTGHTDDADEVVQESFLRAYRQIHRYESRATFGTWIFRIASNYAIDVLRVRKRYVMQRSDGGPEETGDVEEPSKAPLQDRLAFSGEIRERLESALAGLSEQERAAFVLRHMEGLSIPEASETLGINDGATRHSVFRAVKKLRQALAPLVTPAPGGA